MKRNIVKFTIRNFNASARHQDQFKEVSFRPPGENLRGAPPKDDDTERRFGKSSIGNIVQVGWLLGSRAATLTNRLALANPAAFFSEIYDLLVKTRRDVLETCQFEYKTKKFSRNRRTLNLVS